MQAENRKWLINVGLCVVILAASLPLLVNYCIDGVNVGFYIKQMEQGGYRDVFFLIPRALVRMGMPAEWAYRLMLFFINAAAALIAYRAFGRMFEDDVVGLIGAALYTWLPYRLGDLYSRGDLGEAAALCFLPVVLYGLYGIYTRDNRRKDYGRLWLPLALGLSCMLWAYTLSFLTAAAFTVLVCLFFWKKTLRRETLFVLLKAALATAVCGGWIAAAMLYLFKKGAFPASLERTGSIQRGGVYLANYFQLFFVNGSSRQFDESGMIQMQPFGAGFAVTACVLLYLGLTFTGRYKGRDDRYGILLFGGKMLAAGTALLLLSLNCFPWDAIGRKNRLFYVLVNCLQSPSRLLPLAAVCFIFLSCGLVWQVRQWERPEAGRVLAAAVGIAAFLGVQYLTGDILRTGEPRSLYGVPYQESLDEESAFLQANLDISPLDYGRYVSGAAGVPAVVVVWEAGAVAAVAVYLCVWVWRKKRVEKV